MHDFSLFQFTEEKRLTPPFSGDHLVSAEADEVGGVTSAFKDHQKEIIYIF